MSYCEFAKASARRLRHDEMGGEGLKHFYPVTMPTLVPADRANWNLWKIRGRKWKSPGTSNWNLPLPECRALAGVIHPRRERRGFLIGIGDPYRVATCHCNRNKFVGTWIGTLGECKKFWR